MVVNFNQISNIQLNSQIKKHLFKLLNEDYCSSDDSNSLSGKTQVLIEKVRRSISLVINSLPNEIIFTSGGTEANNLALRGLIAKYKITSILTTEKEHESILKPLKFLEENNIVRIKTIPTDNNHNIRLDCFKTILEENPHSLIALSHAHHLTGNLLPVKQLMAISKKNKAFVHLDMCLTLSKFKIDISKMGIDTASFSAYKFNSLPGSGFLYAKHNLDLQPLIFGNNSEFGLRAGFQNIYAIGIMDKALQIALDSLDEHQKYILQLKKQFVESLILAKIKFKIIGNYDAKNLYSIINIQFIDVLNIHDFLIQLDLAAIIVSNGTINQLEPSVRFSFSENNTHKEIAYCIKKIKKIISKITKNQESNSHMAKEYYQSDISDI